MSTAELPDRPVEAGASATAPSPSPDRIRQVHAVCRLLDAEGSRSDRGHVVAPTASRTVRGHGFFQAALGTLVAACGVGLLLAGWWTRDPLQRVRDYRWGPHYDAAEATDALLDRDTDRLHLATRGGGVHVLDGGTRHLRQWTQASTGGGLLSDDVLRIDRDDQRRLYFLCQHEGAYGLARTDDQLGNWSTLIGFDRFPALGTTASLEQLTSVCAVGDRLWFGTNGHGVGVYAPANHSWTAVHEASPEGLLDNRVFDLVADPQGRVWIATAAGVNRVAPSGAWERFTGSALAGAHIVRLAWRDDALWYVTAAGGLGRCVDERWEILASEGGWAQHTDADVAFVLEGGGPGRLWFVTADGAAGRYQQSDRSWTSFPGVTPGVTVNAVSAREANGKSQVIAGTRQGLYALADDAGWQPLGLANQDVRALDASDRIVAQVRGNPQNASDVVHVQSSAGDWRTAAGPNRTQVDARGWRAAALDGPRNRLWVGSGAGLAGYDLRQHDWVAHEKPQEGRLPAAAILDLQSVDERLLVLTEDHRLTAFHADRDQWATVLGGGSFPGQLRDVAAVTRDASGRVWIGTAQRGLHRYDAQSHSWSPVSADLKDITHLATSQKGVWVVAGGTLLFSDGQRPPQPVAAAAKSVTQLFAQPEVDGAVIVTQTGEVQWLNDAGGAQTLVGSPASGLDLRTVAALGVVGDRVVFGGPKPHVYDAAARTWTPLQMDPVVQIVPALQELWLRTAQQQIFRMSAADTTPRREALPVPILALAAAPQELLAAGIDGSLYSRAAAGEWQPVLPKADGPPPSVLRAGDLSAVAAGEDLYLVGDGGGWHFSWLTQRWSPLTLAGKPLERVAQLAADAAAVYAVAGSNGEVWSTALGQSAVAKEPVGDIARLRAAAGVVAATGRQGEVFARRDGKWSPYFGDVAAGLPPSARVSDVALLPQGVVFASDHGAALIDPGLGVWRTIAGDVPLETLLASADARALWAVTADRQLLQLDTTAWTWRRIDFPDAKGRVAAATVGEEQNETVVWAALEDGAVYRLAGGQVTAWSLPTRAGGAPDELVGLVAAPGGFLAAFRPGKLSFFDARRRTWESRPHPGEGELAELIDGGKADETGWCALRTVAGDLFIAPRRATPVWRQAAGGVSDLAIAGSELLAVSATQRQVLRIDATGQAQPLLKASAPPNAALGELIAACELAPAKGPPLLVVAGAERTAVYDPQTHRWTSHAGVYRELHPVAGAIVALTPDARAVRLDWRDGDLQPTQLAAAVARIATSGADQRMLLESTDGRVALYDGAQISRVLFAGGLPTLPDDARIRAVAAVGARLFLALADGRLFTYDPATRGWQQVPGVTGATQLFSYADSLWLEMRTVEGAAFGQVRLNNARWDVRVVVPRCERCDPSPAGPLIETATQQGRMWQVLDADGQLQPLFRTADLGPDSGAAVGARVVGDRLLVKLQSGEIWSTRLQTRRWEPVGELEAPLLESAPFAPRLPLSFSFALEEGTLATSYRGRQWRHEAVLPSTTGPAVTTDGEHVYVATAAGLLRADRSGRWRAQRDWPADGGRLGWVAAAPAGPQLCVHDDADRVWINRNGDWETLPNGAALRQRVDMQWQGRDYGVQISADGRAAVWRDAATNRIVQELDLAGRGFRADRPMVIGLTETNAWIATEQLQRWHLADPAVPPAAFTLAESTKPRIQRLDGSWALLTDQQAWTLPAQGDPERLSLSSAQRTAAAAAWWGTAWRVAARGQGWQAAVRGRGGRWFSADFDPAAGFGWDIPQGVAATKDEFLLVTAAGLFRIRRAAGQDQFDLAAYEPVEAPPGQLSELWSDSADVVWARTDGATWQRWQSQSGTWERVAALPDDVRTQRARLAQSANLEWRRNGAAVELVETPASGPPVAVALSPQGELPSARVRAVVPEGKSLWLVCDGQVRQLDPATGQLSSLRTEIDIDRSTLEVRRDGVDWFLQGKSSVWKLSEQRWTALVDAADTPFARSRTLVETPRLRVSRTAAGMAFAVRSDESWRPVRFLPEQRRFDFQSATDALIEKELAYLATPAGLAVWQSTQNGPVLASLRPDLAEFVVIGDRVYGQDGDGRLFSFAPQRGWQPADVPEEDRRIVARSPRWQLERQGRTHVLAARWGTDQLTPLRWHADGGFDYRRPKWLAAADDANRFAASEQTIVHYRKDDAGRWLPQQFTNLPGDGANRVLQDLFAHAGAVYGDVAGQLQVYSAADGSWRPVADDAPLRAARRVFWNSGGWRWERTSAGALQGELQWDAERRLELQFDPARGRFTTDVVHAAATAPESFWLSTAEGLLHLASRSGRATARFPTPAEQPWRLHYDRRGRRLLAAAGAGKTTVVEPRYDAAKGQASLATADAAEEIAASLSDRFHDAEWTFTAERVQWRGIETDLVRGRFAHDAYHTVAASKSRLCLASPAAISEIDLAPNGPTLIAAWPPPSRDRRYEIVRHDETTLQVVDDGGSVWQLDRTARTWQPVENAAALRTLIDTPFWTWSRTASGSLQIVVRQPHDAPLNPPLTPQGRFPFDHAVASLLDGDALWVAGAHGVARQSADSGELLAWYPRGRAGENDVPLSNIRELARFAENGEPVPSAASAERRAASSLYALDDQDVAWKFADDAWQKCETSPFRGTSGRPRLRTPLLDADETAAGQLALRWRAADAENLPVLQAGRLTADVIQGVAFDDQRAILATAAGLVEADPQSGAYRRLWSAADGEPGRLASSPHVFHAREPDALCARDRAGGLYRLDPAGARWQSIAPVEAAFPRHGDVLYANDFWTWYRWDGGLQLHLDRADETPDGWPLFVDGRFSFDVLRSFRLDGETLWAATPGGLVKFRSEDMSIERIDRTAVDGETGRTVPLLDAVRFSARDELACTSEHHRYAPVDGRWVRTVGAALSDSQVVQDGPWEWRVEPVRDEQQSGGFEIRAHDERGVVVKQRRILRGVPEDRFRKAIVSGSRLWVCLDRGVYWLEGW